MTRKTIPIRAGALIQLKQAVNRVVPFDAKVLDVGAGLCGKYQESVALRAGRYVMVDAHGRYLDENTVRAEKVVGVVPAALKQFEPGSFDVEIWGGFHLDYAPAGAVTRGNNKIPPGASPNALWAVRRTT